MWRVLVLLVVLVASPLWAAIHTGPTCSDDICPPLCVDGFCTCPQDANQDFRITVDELIFAVRCALEHHSCRGWSRFGNTVRISDVITGVETAMLARCAIPLE